MVNIKSCMDDDKFRENKECCDEGPASSEIETSERLNKSLHALPNTRIICLLFSEWCLFSEP